MKISTLGGGAAAAEEEFSKDLHPPIPSHPGMKYPVQASPSLRLIGCAMPPTPVYRKIRENTIYIKNNR